MQVASKTKDLRGPLSMGRAAQAVAQAWTIAFLVCWGISFCIYYAPEPIGSRAGFFLEGAKTTALLTLAAGSMGLVLGTLVGLGRVHSSRKLRSLTFGYVALFQGTPLLVQILFVYYAVPALFPALRLNEFSASVAALALNVAAYNSESIRAGILSIPRGQVEAATCLGLSYWSTLRWVVLPQAFRIVIPPLTSNFSALLKDSALASSIGLLELTHVGNRITSETFLPFPVLATVACIYFGLTGIANCMALFLERKLRVAE